VLGLISEQLPWWGTGPGVGLCVVALRSRWCRCSCALLHALTGGDGCEQRRPLSTEPDQAIGRATVGY
jgi:hypothetical protein